MNLDWLSLDMFVAALPGIAALIAVLIAWRAAKGQRNETAAGTRKTGVEALATVVQTLQTEVTRVSHRVEVIEAEKRVLQARIEALEVERDTLRRRVDDLQARLDAVLKWAIPRGYEPPE